MYKFSSQYSHFNYKKTKKRIFFKLLGLSLYGMYSISILSAGSNPMWIV